MADFSTTASLELEVASGSLRDVKSTIEQELGEMEIGVSADTGGAGGRQQGQLAGILDANRQQFDLAEERNEYLDELVDEMEDMGGTLAGGAGAGGGVGATAAGSAIGRGAAAVGGVAGGALGLGSLLTAGGAAVTIGTATLIIEGLTNEDAFTRRQAREEAEGVTEAGEQGNLPGSRFDESSEDPFNLGQFIGEFEWPKFEQPQMMDVVASSIAPLEWATPGENSIVNEIDSEIESLDWNVPSSDSVLTEISSSMGSIDFDLPEKQDFVDEFMTLLDTGGGNGPEGTFRLGPTSGQTNYGTGGNNPLVPQVDIGDITAEVTANLSPQEIQDIIEEEIDREMSDLERRIRRGANAGR